MPVRFDGRKDLIGMIFLVAGLPLVAMIAAMFMPFGKTGIIIVLLLITAFLIWKIFRKTKS